MAAVVGAMDLHAHAGAVGSSQEKPASLLQSPALQLGAGHGGHAWKSEQLPVVVVVVTYSLTLLLF